MPKITSVEPQKLNPKRFNIFLDGQFAFGADEDLVVEQRLMVGKIIESDGLEKILFDTEVGKIMERMYRLFNIRQRTEKEIRDYLKNLSFKRKIKGKGEMNAYIFDAIVQVLKRKGLLNDEMFARSWVEAREKKYGPKRIKLELLQKGISKEIIDSCFNDLNHLNKDNEAETAQKLLEKKIKHWKSLNPLEFKKKAYGFLLRRGFEYEKVKGIVENVIKKQ